MGWIVWVSFSYVSYTKLKNLFYHSRIKLRICISSKSYKALKEVIGSDPLSHRTKYMRSKDLNYEYFFNFFFSKNRNSYEYHIHINAYKYFRKYHSFFILKCVNYEVNKIKLNFIYN